MNIKCPHCGQLLSEETIKNAVDEDTFKKFLIFLNNNRVISDPLSRFCPNPKCSKVVKLNTKN